MGEPVRTREGSHLTSRDIAQAAGVSQATVSNVLNRPELVSDATTARVRQVMETLGFVVNDSARSLRAGRSRTLGVITLDLSNPFWGEITRGIEAAATSRGYSVLVGASEETTVKERHFLRLFEEHRVDAVLVSSVEAGSSALQAVHRRGTKVVLLDERDETGRYSSISSDELAGARHVGEYLMSLGHRRIAFINGPHTVPWCAARYEGLRSGVAAGGADPDAVIIEITINSMTALAAEPAVTRLLEDAADATAVFCANDMVALGVLKQLSERGIRVPEDLSIVGYDDSYFASLLFPALTTVRQQPFLMGQRAAQLVMDDDGGSEPISIVFHPELVPRQSVRAVDSAAAAAVPTLPR
jgi:LacI family transcriptional regulator